MGLVKAISSQKVICYEMVDSWDSSMYACIYLYKGLYSAPQCSADFTINPLNVCKKGPVYYDFMSISWSLCDMQSKKGPLFYDFVSKSWSYVTCGAETEPNIHS